MGLCLSKKGVVQEEEEPTSLRSPSHPAFPPPSSISDHIHRQKEITPITVKEEKPATKAAETKKQSPLIKRNNRNEVKSDESRNVEFVAAEDGCKVFTAAAVRTSSCTKEEVDAILIQCGRLSRNSSGKGSGEANGRGTSGGSRKYSGSKRSYDFDQDSAPEKSCEDEEKPTLFRPSHGRTFSREREKEGGLSELKRSGSKDESKRSGSRRSSRSPGRRQEIPAEKTKPAAKMVSVPATVSANREAGNGGRKVSPARTKRNTEAVNRGTASPRARSPANSRPASIENAQHLNYCQQPSLSRNSSRKADQSPFRRNPLGEIDENIPKAEQLNVKIQDPCLNKPTKTTTYKTVTRGKEGQEGMNKSSHLQVQKVHENTSVQTPKPKERIFKEAEIPNGTNMNNCRVLKQQLKYCRSVEHQQQPNIVEGPDKSRGRGSSKNSENEGCIPQTISRSRSLRRSRDLDHPDTFVPASYASMLLDDIQNYHNQNQDVAFSLPPCVSKACSILEAVADLNSCTGSNLSPSFSEEKISHYDLPPHHCNGDLDKKTTGKDPFVESEVAQNDNDLTEPSLHKYVTVRETSRDMEKQLESAGSNSSLGYQYWSSSWEPDSAESTIPRKSLLLNSSEGVVEQMLGIRSKLRGGTSNCTTTTTSKLAAKKISVGKEESNEVDEKQE